MTSWLVRSGFGFCLSGLLASALTTGCTDSKTEGATFQGVGFLTEDSSSRAFGVSRDGSTVVGANSSPDGFEGFRWTRATGIEALGIPVGKENSEGLAANRDGSVIAGDAAGFMGVAPRAARWSESGGWLVLEGQGFAPIQARGISADGRILVGTLQPEGGMITREAFIWTEENGFEPLGTIEDGSIEASGISADGTVVSATASFGVIDVALRWTRETGLVELPILEGTDSCAARNISADGTTVAGFCGEDTSPEAVVWDHRGVVSLGFLPGGVGSLLWAISGDGSVGVGEAGDSEGIARAAIWTAADGVRDLREVLADLGLGTEVNGWFLLSANAISSDGHVIAGRGIDPHGDRQGWVATLP